MTASVAQPSTLPVRPSHVLSTYAVGAFAGQLAGFAWIFPLVLIEGDPGVSPEHLALAALSPIAGLLYVELIWWLPRGPSWRMVVFGLVAAATVGVLAGAVAEPTSGLRSLLVAFAIGASTPLAARGLVRIFVRPGASVMALRPGQSIALLLVVVVFFAVASGMLVEVAAAAPVLTVAFAVSLIALGVAIWTAGLRPVDERPRWFRPYGPAITVVLVTVAVVSAWV